MEHHLVIAPHIDDETLGVGGTMLRAKKEGDIVSVVIVTTDYNADRTEQFNMVADIYKLDNSFMLNLDSSSISLLDVNNIIGLLKNIIEEIRPSIVYIPNDTDIHTDHQIVSQAAQSTVKSFYMNKYGIKRLYSYEILSSTEISNSVAFSPNLFIDISDYINKKIEIMNIYKSEIQPEYYPRSIDNIQALAKYRGGMVSINYAEAFKMLKGII